MWTPYHPFFMAYINHLLNNQSAVVTIHSQNNTSVITKEAIIKVVSRPSKAIGKVLTLRGYLTTTWSEAMLTDPDQTHHIVSGAEMDKGGNLTTMGVGIKSMGGTGSCPTQSNKRGHSSIGK